MRVVCFQISPIMLLVSVPFSSSTPVELLFQKYASAAAHAYIPAKIAEKTLVEKVVESCCVMRRGE